MLSPIVTLVRSRGMRLYRAIFVIYAYDRILHDTYTDVSAFYGHAHSGIKAQLEKIRLLQSEICSHRGLFEHVSSASTSSIGSTRYPEANLAKCNVSLRGDRAYRNIDETK